MGFTVFKHLLKSRDIKKNLQNDCSHTCLKKKDSVAHKIFIFISRVKGNTRKSFHINFSRFSDNKKEKKPTNLMIILHEIKKHDFTTTNGTLRRIHK